MLEPAYLSGATPWNQSGFSGSQERWDRLRRPVAESIDRSGSFLDIGCANGYLMECVTDWTAENGLQIEPYGVDLSEAFVRLAKTRLPRWANRLFVGNAWTWEPPQRFDFVNTDLAYVPETLRCAYVFRLLELFVVDGGTLLLSEYRSTQEAANPHWASDYIESWGLKVAAIRSGIDLNGNELTRVTMIRK